MFCLYMVCKLSNNGIKGWEIERKRVTIVISSWNVCLIIALNEINLYCSNIINDLLMI